MKKVALSLLAFGLIGAGAFAQAAPAAPTVTIGDWGRQLFAVGDVSGGGYWVNQGASWYGNPRIVGLNIQAHTDTAGFSITPSADNGSFGLTDQNKAWIAPIPGLTFETGINLETDTWRGIGDFGSFNWLRFAKEKGDSITFTRLGENGGTQTYSTDVNYNKDGIGFWALVQNGANSPGSSPVSTDSVGNSVQIGAAYTIPSLGQLKAQYVGAHVELYGGDNGYSATGGSNATLFGTQSSGTEFGTVQVAFNLSAVKDLSEEIGIQLPTNATDAGYVFQFTDLTQYTIDKTTLHLQVIAVDYNGKNGGDTGFGLGGGAGLDYDVGNSITLNGDFRYRNAVADGSGIASGNEVFEGIQVGVTKGFSNGLIGVAFEWASAYGFAFADNTGGNSGSTSNAHWAIPVRFEEWF